MNILYLSQYYPPETGAGATRADSITRHLAGKGWNVDVVCEIPNYPTGKKPDHLKNAWTNRIEINGINVHQVWVAANPRETFIQKLLLFGSFFVSSLVYLLVNFKKYDVIYASSPPISAAVTGWLLGRLSRTPWIFEVRDLWSESAIGVIGKKSGSPVIRLLKWLENRLYRSASAIVVMTRSAEKIIRKSHPDKDITVVENGADLSRFDTYLRETDTGTLPGFTKNGRFRVGYAGSIGVVHNFRAIVEAAKGCLDDPEIEFLIIGDGSKHRELRNLIESSNLPNLRWIGFRPHEDIPAYISTFDIGLNPILNIRAFRNIVTVKFYEYLACGVPAISMGEGEIAEVSGRSGAAICLGHHDFSGLVSEIKRLKSDPAALDSLRKNARPFIERHYDRGQLAEDVSDLIEKIVGKTPATN